MTDRPYGRFTGPGDAVRLSTHLTPRPWTNVVSNGRYGFVVSNTGSGFAWIDDAQHAVLTRWSMDLIQDRSGRFLYLTDLDGDATWSLAPAPCDPGYDAFECEHATGSTTFRTTLHGVDAEWAMAVHPTDTAEVWTVRLTNRSDRPRRLRLTSFFEWCCGVAPDAKREFHRLFITTERDEARHAIVASSNMWAIPEHTPAEHWNVPWPYVAAHAMHGADLVARHATGDKEQFLGRRGDPARPVWTSAPEPPRNFGRFADACAALAGDLVLGPGASTTVRLVTAAAGSRGELEALLDRHADAEGAARVADESRAAWAERLAPTRVGTDDERFDRMVNTWLPYQAISARLWARTGYYQQSGAVGFRDQLQDSQVWLPLDPDRCKAQILEHAALQFADGHVYHWYHRLADFGSQTACSDDYLWLPFIAATYARDTGDLSILDEHAPFVDDPAGASLLEHCRRSLDRAWSRRSERGLPLIGTCDWNDGLSAAGAGGRGESVWLAFFLAETLDRFAHLCEARGDAELAQTCRARRAETLAAADSHGWDGAWYRRATLDDGTWLGAESCEEGRIYLNPQTWAVLTPGIDPDRVAAAWSSVRAHLLREMGPLLLFPAYVTPDERIGYITRYSPGSRENGGVYTHAACWALAAACKRKDVEAAERIYGAINPTIASERDPDLYAAEPYATPGNIDGPLSDTPGRAGWTWYTGSAAWLHRISLEYVIGLRPTWEGLAIDPCPLPSLGAVDARRLWRGRSVRLRYDSSGFAPGSEPLLTVNGRPQASGLVTEADAPPGGEIDAAVGWGPVEIRTKQAAPAAAERSLP
jgi:cellobiose phosphorylase